MIPAPVGFRCPECVKEQNARGTRAKVVTRGQIRSRWSAGALGGSAGLTGDQGPRRLNVAIFVLELLSGAVGAMGGGSARRSSTGRAGPVLVPAARVLAAVHLHVPARRPPPHRLQHVGAVDRAAGSSSDPGPASSSSIYFISGFAGSVLVLAGRARSSVMVGASGGHLRHLRRPRTCSVPQPRPRLPVALPARQRALPARHQPGVHVRRAGHLVAGATSAG